MHKALRIPQTATPEKKEDKGQTVISPQELLADADALLLKFREEIGASDFRDVTATPTKGKESTKKKQGFGDLLAVKIKEIDAQVSKARKKNLMTVAAAALSAKGNALSGAKMVFVKARSLHNKDNDVNKRAFKAATALAQSKHDFTVKEFPFIIKAMSAKAPLQRSI